MFIGFKIYLFLSGFIISMTSVFLAIYVLIKSREEIRFSFFYLLLSILAYGTAYSFSTIMPENEVNALITFQVIGVATMFIPVSTFHFIVNLIDQVKKYKGFIVFGYTQALFFSVIVFSPYYIADVVPKFDFGFCAVPGFVHDIHLLFYAFYFIFAIGLAFKSFEKSIGILKTRIRYALWGISIGSLAITANFLIWHNINFPPYSTMLVVLFPTLLAYVMLVNRFFDFKLIFHKILVHLLSLTTIAIFLVFFKFVSITFFHDHFSIMDLFILFIVIFFIYPIKRFYKSFFSAKFFDFVYEPSMVVSAFSDKLSKTLKAGGIYVETLKFYRKYFNITALGFLKIQEKKHKYDIVFNNGFEIGNIKTVEGNKYLFHEYTAQGRPIILDELMKNPHIRYQETLIKLQALNVSMLLPLNFNNQSIGLLAVGPKIGGEQYSKEEIDLMELLTSIAATNLFNAFLYQKLEEKNNESQELLLIKNEFLRLINHNLNNQLSIMRMGMDSYNDGSVEKKKAVAIIGRGLERMENTLSDFWDAYEFEGNKKKMNIESLDMNDLLHLVIESKKKWKLLKKKKIKLELNGLAPVNVMGDKKYVEHVLSGLIDNSVRYSESGIIDFSFKLVEEDDKEYLKMLIKDQGSGISISDQASLFKKFARGEKALSSFPEGTGLGLYVAKKIMQANKGNLFLEKSVLGEGSTFSLTLPVDNIADQLKVRTEEVNEDDGVISRKFTLMIFDDVEEAERLRDVYFSDKNFTVFIPKDLDEAIKIVRTKKLDVVISEIIIPGKTTDGTVNPFSEQGYTFLQMLKRSNLLRKVSVLVYSNINNDRDMKKALQLGAKTFLNKNRTTKQDLVRAIKKL